MNKHGFDVESSHRFNVERVPTTIRWRQLMFFRYWLWTTTILCVQFDREYMFLVFNITRCFIVFFVVLIRHGNFDNEQTWNIGISVTKFPLQNSSHFISNLYEEYSCDDGILYVLQVLVVIRIQKSSVTSSDTPCPTPLCHRFPLFPLELFAPFTGLAYRRWTWVKTNMKHTASTIFLSLQWPRWTISYSAGFADKVAPSNN